MGWGSFDPPASAWGDLGIVAAATGLAVGVFDALVGYASGGSGFRLRDHLAPLPQVVLLVGALHAAAGAVLAPLARRTGRSAGALWLALAVATIAVPEIRLDEATRANLGKLGYFR